MPGYFFDVVAKAFLNICINTNPFSLIFKKNAKHYPQNQNKKNLFKVFYGLEALLTPIVF